LCSRESFAEYGSLQTTARIPLTLLATNGYANSRATKEQPFLAFAAGNGFADFKAEVAIVNSLQAERT
jgi:hypothetical protein